MKQQRPFNTNRPRFGLIFELVKIIPTYFIGLRFPGKSNNNCFLFEETVHQKGNQLSESHQAVPSTMSDLIRSIEQRSRFLGTGNDFPHIDIQTRSSLDEISPSYETSECGYRNAKL